MIEMECPWCGEGQAVDPLSVTADVEFACERCGTVVRYVDEAQEALPLAA